MSTSIPSRSPWPKKSADLAQLIKHLGPWLNSMLELHRKIILETTARMQALEAQCLPAEHAPDGGRLKAI